MVDDQRTGAADPPAKHDPAEERLLRKLRLLASGVVLLMIVMIVSVDTLGRLLLDPNFHASELFLGTLIGALLLLLGVEGVTRLPGKKP